MSRTAKMEGSAAAAAASPTPAAAASSSSSSPAPRTSPMPAAAAAASSAASDLDEDEDELINENINEEDLVDVKEGAGKKKRGKGAAAASSGIAPTDALDRLNDLLHQTEQFAKFVPNKAEKKKGGRGGGAGRHHERAEEEAEDKELVADELAQTADTGKSWPDHLDEQPTSVNKDKGLLMRDYQLEALNWLIKLHDQNLNGILADEMGLGKTLESLSLLAYLKQYRNYAGPHLVIVPKSTSSNWLKEVKRWTNNLSVFRFHGNAEERDALKPSVASHDVTVTTYEMVILEKSFFAKQKWHYIYIDEAHRIKNENSLLSRVVRTFKSDHRLLITGTPLQNNLHELWALLNFLVPQLFHSSADFASWFDFTESAQRGEIVSRLHRLLRPFLLRRLKSEVEKALLPKIETKLFVGMSVMQKLWYKKILERDIEVLNATNTSKVRLLNIVMQLRKVCNHPYLFTGAEPGPPFLEGEHIVENSSKMVLLDKLLKKLKAAGNRVLIFSQMTRILDILEDFSRYRGYDYCRIDGQTKQDERDEAMEVYNAPNSKKFIFLLSTRAGGLGINLQTADTVILFDSDWNPQQDLQAMDRAHRIGQKKQVTVFRFVVEHSIEQKMVERATKKLYLDALVVKSGRLNDAEKAVSANELQEMVRFGANRIFHSNTAGTGEQGDEITDADIDLILSRGSELTRQETEKLKSNTQNDLLNFSMNDDKGKENFQMFEGKDYTGFRAATNGFEFIEPAKRERKSNYDINQYYRDALRVNDIKKPKQIREFKPIQRFDYQFYQIERLEILEKKEHDSKQKLVALKMVIRAKEREEKRVREENEKNERRKARYAKMRQQRLADAAAAGQTLPITEGKEEDMSDSDDEAAPAASSSSAPAVAAAASSTDGVTKMEIDEDASSPKKSAAAASSSSSVKAEPVVKTEDGVKSEDAVMKSEDDGPRKNPRRSPPAAASGKSTADAAPSPMPTNANNEEDEHAEAGLDDNSGIDAELMAEAGCLTPDEVVELKQLQSEGFGTWSRRHITSFTKAMEKFGRDDLTNVKMCVEEKTPDEVEKYYYAFWSKFTQIKDHDKIIKIIERGEQKLAKQKALQLIIDNKVRKYKSDFSKMTIPYPNSSVKSFTEDEDKFLIVSLHRLGYGNWEDLKSSIRSSWMFRFDWFLKSRTCGELSKRVEYLLKLLEKEQNDWEEKRASDEINKKKKVMHEAKKQISAAQLAANPTPTKKKTSSTSTKSSSSSSTKKKDDSSSSTKKKSSSDDKDKEKHKSHKHHKHDKDGKEKKHTSSSSHKDGKDKDKKKDKDGKDKDKSSSVSDKKDKDKSHKHSHKDKSDKDGGKEHKHKHKSDKDKDKDKDGKDKSSKDKDKKKRKEPSSDSSKDKDKEKSKDKESDEASKKKKQKVKDEKSAAAAAAAEAAAAASTSSSSNPATASSSQPASVPSSLPFSVAAATSAPPAAAMSD